MGDCVKIRSRYALTLPGGYPVPVAVCVETYFRTAPQAAPLSQADASALLEAYCARQLQHELVAGKVLDRQSALCAEADGYRLTQTLHCHEMIARRAELPILEMEQDGTIDQRGTDGAAH